jgi:hypothetical protein
VAIASSPDEQARPQLEGEGTAGKQPRPQLEAEGTAGKQPRPQLEAEDKVEVPMKQNETKVDKLAQ